MISTVTTTTVTTVASTMAVGFGLLATLALIVLLVTKELAGSGVQASGGGGTMAVSRTLDRVLNVAIVPLLFVFGYIVISRVIAVLH